MCIWSNYQDVLKAHVDQEKDQIKPNQVQGYLGDEKSYHYEWSTEVEWLDYNATLIHV